MAVYTQQMIYDSDGYSGKTYYALVVQKNSGAAWNYVVEAMQVNPERVFCALVLPEVGLTGRYKINLPTNLPKGIIYDISIYNQAGATPVNGDDLKETFVLSVGGIFGF